MLRPAGDAPCCVGAHKPCGPCLPAPQDRLDALARAHANFRVHFIVDRSSSPGWQGRWAARLAAATAQPGGRMQT